MGKATGFDEISSKFLKIGETPFAEPISRLMNLSILECKFPDILKHAKVNALFKRIDELLKENYRPVSLITAVSKIFERVFNIQMSTNFDMLFNKLVSGLLIAKLAAYMYRFDLLSCTLFASYLFNRHQRVEL